MEDRANVLAVYETCKNYSETSRITGVPTNTIRAWHVEDCKTPPAELVEQRKQDLKTMLVNLVNLAGAATAEKIANGEGSVRELVGVIHIGVEKINLLDGGPTSRVEHTVGQKLTPEQREKVKMDIVKKHVGEEERIKAIVDVSVS